MSILHYQMNNPMRDSACIGLAPSQGIHEERLKRNPAQDLKEGIDLVFEFKAKLDKMHPIATETLIRLLCM
jgi:hypothetical protein